MNNWATIPLVPCAISERVIGLAEASGDDAVFATPVGAVSLAGYLPTRTFELTVHGLDLSRALGIVPPPALAVGVAASCELAGRLAARSRRAADLLMMVTGRGGVSEATVI